MRTQHVFLMSQSFIGFVTSNSLSILACVSHVGIIAQYRVSWDYSLSASTLFYLAFSGFSESTPSVLSVLWGMAGWGLRALLLLALMVLSALWALTILSSGTSICIATMALMDLGLCLWFAALDLLLLIAGLSFFTWWIPSLPP